MVKPRKTTITFMPESSIGAWARSVRKALNLTQQEQADITGVSKEDVDSFENNLPIKLDSRRKLVKELWVVKQTE
jgi:transcriptional regulator with XRE-family HTH domain